jgi:hypothetical protein
MIASADLIQLSFTSFNTSVDIDFVTINSCSDSLCLSKVQVAKLSGTGDTSNVFKSSTGYLQVVFTSDSNSVVRTGFKANWSVVTNSSTNGTKKAACRTKSQFLDAGPRNLNIATNGGLTIVAVVRFSGTPVANESIINFFSGADTPQVFLARGTLDWWCLSSPGTTSTCGNTSQTNITCPCSRFFALIGNGTMGRTFASVSTRSNAPVGSAILPVYNASGGPQGKGHVTFKRGGGSLPGAKNTATNETNLTNETNVTTTFPICTPQSQFLDAGPRYLSIATNGGLTIVAVVRFTGTSMTNESIINFFSGVFSNETTLDVFLTREENTAGLKFGIANPDGTLVVQTTLQNAIVQDTWLTVVARYRASTMEYSLTVNHVTISGTATVAVTDKTLSGTYIGIGKETDTGGDFNGDMAGVFVLDEYLSTAATDAIADSMVRGVDLTKPTSSDNRPNALASCTCNNPDLQFGIAGPNGTLAVETTLQNVIVQDTWLTVVARYHASTGE